jgi:signal recognition particle subunit SRP72
MADKNADQIKALYVELHKIAPSQDWERILKISKKILGFSIYETKAFQCKIVCLIHLDKFDEALTSIERSPDTGNFYFEKAYCEYRLNKNEESYATLQKIQEMSVREKELLAQVVSYLNYFIVI